MSDKRKNSELWIDLTMLLNWQGQLTGIQRVEYNLALRFASREDTYFCVFDKQNRVLVPYDFEHIKYKVTQLKAEVQSVESVRNEKHFKSLKGYIYPIVRRIPQPVKSKIKKIAKTHNKNKSVDKAKHESVNFHEGDSLLILSGDWSDSIFAHMVRKYKSEEHIKVVQVVYDMLPAVQPSFFVPGMPKQFTNYMHAVFTLCDGILAISKATKKDIVTFMKIHDIKPVPVEVFRLGDDFSVHVPQKPTINIKERNYILCVGTVEARKNHQLLYYAVKNAIESHLELPPIVVVGKKGWLVDNLLYLIENDQSLKDKIILLHNTNDLELAWLFTNCLFTIYPSFYEGWGLPIAESLFYNKFCIASNTSSMPEIAGDLVDYFSPYDPASALYKILEYANNPTVLLEREKNIEANYNPTTWQTTYTAVERYITNLME